MTTGDNQEPQRYARTVEAARKVTAADGGPRFDFLSSIIAGLLLGVGLDWWLSTAPIFTIIGIVLGSVSGFMKLWVTSAKLEDQAKERLRA